MSLFAIADLHLSFGKDKPMDIFTGWNDYVQRIEKNWKMIVKQSDTVVIPGDISWAMKLEETKEDFEFIHSLPGKKILLKGNHDYWWSTKKKVENFLIKNGFDDISIIFNSAQIAEDYAICGTRGWYYDAEEDTDKKILNREVGRLTLSIEQALLLNSEPLVFLHYPPVYNGIECKEIMEVLIKYNIKNCCYGHLHGRKISSKAITGIYKNIKFHLVSCDNTGFAPVLIK